MISVELTGGEVEIKFNFTDQHLEEALLKLSGKEMEYIEYYLKDSLERYFFPESFNDE